jgi:hypothetical protein
VRRLVSAHIAAIDAGHLLPFGEFGAGGAVYTLSPGAVQLWWLV